MKPECEAWRRPPHIPGGQRLTEPTIDRATQEILRVARGVLENLDVDQVLERVLAAARELTDARYAALGVLNDSKTRLARFLTIGIDGATRQMIGDLPKGRGVLGVLIEDPVPLRVSDVGEHPRSYGFPHGHPPMHSFLGVPILIGGEPFGNLYLTDKTSGSEFSEADEEAVGVLADFAGVAIDNAKRYTGASERRDELQRTVAALEASSQIALALGGETDPEIVLQLVAKRGRALISARALLIEQLRGHDLVIAASAGELPPDLLGRRISFEGSLAAHAMRTGRLQRIEEELNRARFRESALGRLGIEADAGLVVPLMFRGSPQGVLVALDRLSDGPSFSAEDARLLDAFAASAATAVATAQSVSTERHRQRLAATEHERQRWARELHDETLQSLGALRLALSSAERSERPADFKRVVRESVKQVEQEIANLRTLITELRPASLDELGTQAAIEALVERSRGHGIEIDVSVELAYEEGREPSRHTSELELAIYRIVQEALTNASRHGKAKRAALEIREDADAVHLTVRDDGSGFDPDAVTDGFGLMGIRERVELLDGELLIDSAPDRGTVISARLPVRRRERPHSGPTAVDRTIGLGS
jgi:signal transduction histidine kinase